MGRIVKCPLVTSGNAVLPVTNDSDQDIFEIAVGNGNDITLLGFRLYSEAIAAESLNMRLVIRTAAGTGGSSPTEYMVDQKNTTTIGGVVTTLVTAPSATGLLIKEGFFWEMLGPLFYTPVPEERITIDGDVTNNRICLNINGTVLAAETDMTGAVWWRED